MFAYPISSDDLVVEPTMIDQMRETFKFPDSSQERRVYRAMDIVLITLAVAEKHTTRAIVKHIVVRTTEPHCVLQKWRGRTQDLYRSISISGQIYLCLKLSRATPVLVVPRLFGRAGKNPMPSIRDTESQALHFDTLMLVDRLRPWS